MTCILPLCCCQLAIEPLRCTSAEDGGVVAVINSENGTLKPVAIFHSVATVGLDSPRSICPSMALLTPVCSRRHRQAPFARRSQ